MTTNNRRPAAVQTGCGSFHSLGIPFLICGSVADIGTDLKAYQFGGATATTYDILKPYQVGKGGGSAYGGAWKPSKPADERFIGTPGEVKVFFKKDGTKIETKIGEDGRAVKERHYTDHGQPQIHSNPHDHRINWESPRYGIPNFEKPHINYWPDAFPDGAPKFKSARSNDMKYYYNTEEENRFKTISEFKECLIRGGEIEFTWKNFKYGISHSEDKIIAYAWNQPDTTQYFNTPDEALEYRVGADRLRDVITQVTVLDRTI